MKIEDKRRKKPTTFFDLETGDAFEYEGMLWIKTNYDKAFNLESEETECIVDDTTIHKVKISITVEDY